MDTKDIDDFVADIDEWQIVGKDKEIKRSDNYEPHILITIYLKKEFAEETAKVHISGYHWRENTDAFIDTQTVRERNAFTIKPREEWRLELDTNQEAAGIVQRKLYENDIDLRELLEIPYEIEFRPNGYKLETAISPRTHP